MKKKILRLNVKRKYWDLIKSGEKKEEYRIFKPYWITRLVSYKGRPRQYDEIHICLGYPKSGDMSKTLVRPWLGYEIKEIEHEIFESKRRKVFAIEVNE